MRSKTTTINGYQIELEFYQEEDPVSHCWVGKGSYESSLAKLGQTGTIENSADEELTVPDVIIHKIEDWAEANGY